MSPKEDSEENLNMKEIEKEKDYYMQFEINPDFRRFVRKLSRCRSIASLDVSNVISGDEGVTNNNEPIKTPEKIEDEKGKKGERVNKADDSIQIKDYKQNNRQQRSQRERKMGTWMNTDFYEETNNSGRGEVGSQKVSLTLLVAGGVVQHPLYHKSALRPSKWPPNTPKFRDFSYFYMT